MIGKPIGLSQNLALHTGECSLLAQMAALSLGKA